MKAIAHVLVFAIFLSLNMFSPTQAADCAGSWQRIPNYKKSMGAPCQYLGLDTHKGTCQPGKEFETLCDDAAGGQYRTCQGPRRCNNKVLGNSDCRHWDFVNNQTCPPGYVNVDCKGYCEQDSPGGGDNCKNWDFVYNRPCPQGYINYDCQGGCEPVSFRGK